TNRAGVSRPAARYVTARAAPVKAFLLPSFRGHHMSASAELSIRNYSLAEVAVLIGVSRPTAREMDKAREIPGRLRDRGQARCKRAVVDRWLEGREVAGDALRLCR